MAELTKMNLEVGIDAFTRYQQEQLDGAVVKEIARLKALFNLPPASAEVGGDMAPADSGARAEYKDTVERGDAEPEDQRGSLGSATDQPGPGAPSLPRFKDLFEQAQRDHARALTLVKRVHTRLLQARGEKPPEAKQLPDVLRLASFLEQIPDVDSHRRHGPQSAVHHLAKWRVEAAYMQTLYERLSTTGDIFESSYDSVSARPQHYHTLTADMSVLRAVGPIEAIDGSELMADLSSKSFEARAQAAVNQPVDEAAAGMGHVNPARLREKLTAIFPGLGNVWMVPGSYAFVLPSTKPSTTGLYARRSLMLILALLTGSAAFVMWLPAVSAWLSTVLASPALLLFFQAGFPSIALGALAAVLVFEVIREQLSFSNLLKQHTEREACIYLARHRGAGDSPSAIYDHMTQRMKLLASRSGMFNAESAALYITGFAVVVGLWLFVTLGFAPLQSLPVLSQGAIYTLGAAIAFSLVALVFNLYHPKVASQAIDRKGGYSLPYHANPLFGSAATVARVASHGAAPRPSADLEEGAASRPAAHRGMGGEDHFAGGYQPHPGLRSAPDASGARHVPSSAPTTPPPEREEGGDSRVPVDRHGGGLAGGEDAAEEFVSPST